MELNAALTALEISNVEVSNLPKYLEAKDELEVEATDLTVADVQKLVDDVNAKNLSAEEEVALVKAIVKAVDAENEVLTLSTLEAAGISPLNSEWAGDYITALTGITDATTLKTIQTTISDENDVQVQAEVTDTGVDKKVLTESLELIEAYATVTETGDYKVGAIGVSVEDIKEQIALAEVLEATTPTAFKNKLTALATLVDDTTILDMADYVDANGKAYIAALKAETVVTNKDTVDLVEAILFSDVNSVNATEAASLVTAVNDAATAIEAAAGAETAAEKTALLKALNNLGVKQVVDANIAEYVKVATDLKTVADLAEAQTQVDTANLAAVTAADKNTIIAKLNIFGIDNVVSANAEAYVADIVVPAVGADNKATIAAVKAAVKAVNDQVAEDAAVASINKATTAAQVKNALDTLAISEYLNVTSADRIFIAEQVLDARDKVTTPVAKEFADKAAVTTAVQTAATARTNAITDVNALVITDDLTTIADALLAVGHSSLTGEVGTPTANDTAIADAFITSVKFDENGKIVPQYRSIAEIRTALSGL